MTRVIAAFFTWLCLAAVIGVSGGYTVHYLNHWQWVRAQIAGIAFIAALVIAATVAVLGRLRRMERHLAVIAAALARPPDETGPPVPAQGSAGDVEPRPDFRWLGEEVRGPLTFLPVAVLATLWPVAPHHEIFIPVFLATGLLVSAVAWLVERLSSLRHRGRPTPVPAMSADELGAQARTLVVTRPVRMLLVIPLVAAVAVTAVIIGLYRTSHYRPQVLGPGITTFTVRAEQHGGPPTTARQSTETVGRYCAINTGVDVRYRDVAAGPGRTVLLRVFPLLDETAQNRFVGCLEDAILDQHRLTVTSTALSPG